MFSWMKNFTKGSILVCVVMKMTDSCGQKRADVSSCLSPNQHLFFSSNIQGKIINRHNHNRAGVIRYSLFWAAVGRHNGLIEIMRRSTHNITHTPKISLSFEENKHSGETWSILFTSLAQISCTEKTNRLQSTLRLQCTKLIRLRFFFFFFAQGLNIFH